MMRLPVTFLWVVFLAGLSRPASGQDRVCEPEPDPNLAGPGCVLSGPCDLPEVRDAHIPIGDERFLTIRLAVHVFCLDSGDDCHASPEELEDAIALLNANFLPARIRFRADAYFEHDSAYHRYPCEIPAGICPVERDMKQAYVVDPDRMLNIYVVDRFLLVSNSAFCPWEPRALRPLGGVIIDGAFFVQPPAGAYNALTRLVGQALGLWHVQQGTQSTPSCSDACREHSDGSNGDVAGDFCSDTAAVSLDDSGCPGPVLGDPCADCQPWPASADEFQNYMFMFGLDLEGFSGNRFTAQQLGRMRCWVQSHLTGWLIECPADVDQDLDVDVDDAIAVLDRFGATGAPADVTGDGRVDLDDLLLVLGNAGQVCN